MSATMQKAPAAARAKGARTPEENGGARTARGPDPALLSQAFFLWLLWPLFLSYRRPIQEDETPQLYSSFASSTSFEVHGGPWLAAVNEGRPHRRLWKMVLFDLKPMTMSIGIFANLLSGIIVTVGRPLALRHAVRYLEEGAFDVPGMASIVALLSGIVLLEGWLTIWGKHLVSDHFSTAFFSCVSGLILSKAAMSPAGKDNPINLLGNDCVRSIDNLRWVGVLFSAVGGITGGIVMLLMILGPSSLVGLTVAFGIMGLNMCISKETKRSEKANLAASDHRVDLLRQTINLIAGVKFFAWEQNCLRQICEARDDECRKIRRFRAFQMLSVNIGRISPVLSCLGSFLTFAVILGEPLKPSDIFSALLIFQSMRMSLISIPTNLATLQNLALSLGRIETFLKRPSFPARDVCSPEGAEQKLACLRFAACSPAAPSSDDARAINVSDQRQAFFLRDIQLGVPARSLTAVLGPVGSGKSTLLRALLGALPISGEGSVAQTCSSVGLVPQRPVTLNATIQDNILMGRPFQADVLAQAVNVAKLATDLELLPNGMDTLVGERGTTLSGGQQMRLAIARAIYGQPDLLVLDDPLAALDHVVGSQVLKQLENYARGRASEKGQRGRAVVMALNQVHFIHSFDHAIWLEGGRARAQGSPGEVVSLLDLKVDNNQGTVDDLGAPGSTSDAAPAISLDEVKVSLAPTEKPSAAPVAAAEKKAAGAQSAVSGKLEQRDQGVMKSTVYVAFIRALGPALSATCAITFTASYGLMAFADRWLAVWIRADTEGGGGPIYPLIYMVAVLLHSFLMNLGSLLFAEAGMRASRTLHRDCLVRVLKAPMAWFEETPSGRTLSRFSSDLGVVDLMLALNLDNTTQMLLAVLAMAMIIFMIVPIVMVAALVGSVLYYFEAVAVDRMNREVKRLRDSAMAPLQTNLNEVIGFLPLLQVDAREGRLHHFFLERHFHFADRWNRHTFTSFSLMNFGQQLTYYISFLFSAAATSLILGTGTIEPATSGLAFTYCFLVPYFLGIMSMLFVMTNHSFTSLERLLELRSDRVPSEAWPAGGVFVEDGQTSLGPRSSKDGAKIELSSVDLRYRPGLPLAVKGLSLTIHPGERVGIVGRTGSGKSSIFVLLFRLVEPAGGLITVDGTDISKVGLHCLRSNIGMIPQSPVLLSGTVRKNLDPFDEFKGRDGELTSALKQAELSDLTLNTEVGAGGSGLSAGECQLLSFARCLLRQTRVVVLDEPTASVDFETDRKLQTLVRSAFKGRTLLCIAHRLQSVIDFDRILVMDAGRQAALGPPSLLLADRDSALSQIVDGGAKAGAVAPPAATPCCGSFLGFGSRLRSRSTPRTPGGRHPSDALLPTNPLRVELERLLEERSTSIGAVPPA